ncbi:zinc-binding alcohol dehydrogenase family protein [Rapidithrix thailandica]|uniref:Zinc-binding alcohol dehydrogenase family protein n=1 Tax=Rapidithrix thailandica TaxID=413964 RepID=A0AAW9S6W1_9BACT
MKTIRLKQPGQFEWLDLEQQLTLQENEALVKVHRIGVCGTDIHAYAGKQPFFSYPRILGHELGVEVIEVPENSFAIHPGDFCAVEPYLNCGKCSACQRNKPNCCENIQVMGVHTDGGMREYVKVPIHKLHPSKKLSLEQLALVETLGIGAHAVSRAGVSSEDVVLVIGAGPIGLSAIEFVKIAGAEVVVMDISEDRLGFCRQVLGVQNTVNASYEPVEQLKSVLGGELPTVVLDATGNPKSMMGAFEYVAFGGRMVYVGLFQGDITFHDPYFHKKELTLMGSRNALPQDFKNIIGWMEEGRLDTRPWITHQASFEDTLQAFPAWTQPANNVIKAMICL